jgi:hypothetical protein
VAAAELDDDEEEEPRLVRCDSTRVGADDEDDREWEWRFVDGGAAGGAPGGVADGVVDGVVRR